jgi:Rrf2 family iron-sulfur cluster assembly transcriptional regulator
MRFSLQVRYAICGVFDLAYNGHGDPIQVRAISARQAIPVRYLEQIFQRLRRAGIVGSKRGPGGGYSLARGAAEITLRQIVEAVEGPLAEALELEAGEADEARSFRPDFLWQQLAERLGDALDSVTVESLCRDATSARVPRASSRAPMYFI